MTWSDSTSQPWLVAMSLWSLPPWSLGLLPFVCVKSPSASVLGRCMRCAQDPLKIRGNASGSHGCDDPFLAVEGDSPAPGLGRGHLSGDFLHPPHSSRPFLPPHEASTLQTSSEPSMTTIYCISRKCQESARRRSQGLTGRLGPRSWDPHSSSFRRC